MEVRLTAATGTEADGLRSCLVHFATMQTQVDELREGFVVLLASWILGMYLAWSGYVFLGKPHFVFCEDTVRWTLEIHRGKVQPIILPLWRHR